jgi:HAD superfamily hydrolase (TIGR01549 family)
MFDQHTIAFIDFDKTIYDLQIPDYEEHRGLLAKTIKEKFNVETRLYPILEDTIKISESNSAIKKYVYDYIDDIEMKASGYFYDYAEDFLKDLAEKMPVVIVSNNSSRVIEERLKKQDLNKYVKYIYGRDTGDFYKPMKEVLEYCCAQVDITPAAANNFIYAGDSWRDYQCVAHFAAKHSLNFSFIHPKMLTKTHA